MPLLSRCKMPITVGFQLRPVKKGFPYSDLHPLQIRIRVSTPATPYAPPQTKEARIGAMWPLDGAGDKLLVPPLDWDQATLKVRPKSHPVNDSIEQLRGYVKNIYREQKQVAPPTLDSVLFQIEHARAPIFQLSVGWQTVIPVKAAKPIAENYSALYTPISEESSLTEVYAAYVINLRLRKGNDKLSHITIGRWERGLFLLNEWQTASGQSVPPCHKVTLRWLKEYHSWLQTQSGGRHHKKPVSAGQASRFVGKVGAVLQWLVDDDLLTHNPVKKMKWPHARDKEIQFLEKEHIQKLFGLDWSGTAGTALWWFLLMSCTGLDYPDAVAYAKDRDSLERDTAFGRKLVGRRMKPPCVEYDVPLLAEVDLLFQVHPKGAPAVTAQCVNRYTSNIQDALGITWRITNKTARKTFGCLMLQAGFNINTVSRMMGHNSTVTTSRHYVKVTGNQVDRDRERVGFVSIMNNPEPQQRMA